MNIKFEFNKEKNKILVMVILCGICCFLTYYFHTILETGMVFTHFFYIPIILAVLWWRRKGLVVAIFLAVLLILSHIFVRVVSITANDYFRAFMFIGIAYVVAILSERIVKIEGTIRETSDYLDSLINYSNAPIIVWESEFRITRFNHAFERLTGYTTNDVIGQELSILFPKASRDESLSKIERTLSGEYWESVEIPIICKDGEIRLALWNSANIYAEDGKTLLATIAQGTDITERKQAEEALSASKAYAESIIQNFLDTLIVVDTEAKIKTVNPATCDLLGYAEEELIGQPITIIFAEKKEKVRRFFQFFRSPHEVRKFTSQGEPQKAEDLRAQDTIRNRELTYKTKDGQLIPMSFNFSVLFDEIGEITGVVAGAKDITDIKFAEIEIRREKNFSANVIASVPDSLIVLDRNLRIKKANISFQNIFGIEPENAAGIHITDILGDKDGKLTSALSQLIGTKTKIENFELTYRSEKFDKRIFNISARGIVQVEKNGNDYENGEEILIVIEDITKRKKADETLQRFNKALEEKVKVRTAELNKIIIESKQQRIATLNTLNDLDKTNVDLISEMKKRKQAQKIQKTLYNISNAVNTTDNMQDLYSQIREFLGNVIDTKNFYIALYDENQALISFPYFVDEKDATPAPQKIRRGITEYVLRIGKPIFGTEQVMKRLIKEGEVGQIGTLPKIWLGVPLKVENKVIGVIAVQSYDDPNLYSEKDIDILTFISEEIALAIQHKQAEDQIRRELKEKVILLREVHHRVKNNLQVISGLLQLQQNEITSKEDALKGFAASQDRIRAMAKAYEILLGSEYISEVSVGKYIESLAEQLKYNYDVHSKVKISYSLEELTIGIEILDRLGLILNEIITNSIKYAFEGRDKGNIHIELKETEKHFVIKISDDGIGIPEEINIDDPDTLGLSLVDMLTTQLKGTLSLDRKNGTSFTLEIPKESEA